MTVESRFISTISRVLLPWVSSSSSWIWTLGASGLRLTGDVAPPPLVVPGRRMPSSQARTRRTDRVMMVRAQSPPKTPMSTPVPLFFFFGGLEGPPGAGAGE